MKYNCVSCFCGARARDTSKERGRFNRRHRPNHVIVSTIGEDQATWEARHKTWVLDGKERYRRRQLPKGKETG